METAISYTECSRVVALVHTVAVENWHLEGCVSYSLFPGADRPTVSTVNTADTSQLYIFHLVPTVVYQCLILQSSHCC